MANFRCNCCNEVYEDYYPPDDTCVKCKRGYIRIINGAVPIRPASFHFKEDAQ